LDCVGLLLSRSASSLFIKYKVLIFRSRRPPGSPESPLLAFWGGMSAMTRDHGDFVQGRFVADLVTLSPLPHPPWPLLLQIKTKVQFDWTVTERSKPFFGFFWPRIASIFFAPSQTRLLLIDQHGRTRHTSPYSGITGIVPSSCQRARLQAIMGLLGTRPPIIYRILFAYVKRNRDLVYGGVRIQAQGRFAV
jgi:hypothetical protein